MQCGQQVRGVDGGGAQQAQQQHAGGPGQQQGRAVASGVHGRAANGGAARQLAQPDNPVQILHQATASACRPLLPQQQHPSKQTYCHTCPPVHQPRKLKACGRPCTARRQWQGRLLLQAETMAREIAVERVRGCEGARVRTTPAALGRAAKQATASPVHQRRLLQ